MESKKRKADLQLTAENIDEGTTPIATSSDGPKIDGETESIAEPAVPVSGGFSSYAKSNPFAAAIANNQSKGSFGTGFGSFGAARSSSLTMPPPLTLPSPKSPKANPFSSPSPAHNPFMTIVENDGDLWKSMANDKLTAEEVAKTALFGEGKDKKSPAPFRNSFFGGGGHSTFGSVAATSAAVSSNVASVFGGSASSQFGASTATTSAADDGEDDGEDGNDANDLEGSPTANHASMKIISLPENVKLVTGEEDDECLLQFRAKLYRFSTHLPATDTAGQAAADAAEDAAEEEKGSLDASHVLSAVEKARASKAKGHQQAPGRAEWLEVGIGPLKILSRKSAGAGRMLGRLVMRREDKQGGQGTKLLLNARLDKYLTASRQNDKMVQLVCVNHAELPLPGAPSSSAMKIGTYLIKTKTSDEADDMYSIVHDFISRAKEDLKDSAAGTTAAEETNGTHRNGGEAGSEAVSPGSQDSPAKCSMAQSLRSSSPVPV